MTDSLAVPAVRVQGPAELARLCERLRAPAEDSAAGEEAFEEEADARTKAMEGRYVADVPAHGFAFAAGADPESNRDEGTLLLSDRGFSLDEAAVIDRPPGEEPLFFRLGRQAAERVLQMHAQNAVFLRLVFTPQPTQLRPDACLRQSGGRSLKLSAQVLAAYVMGRQGAVVARYETDGFAQVMAEATPVEQPAVTVGKAISADTTPVPSGYEQALAKLQDPLLGCYQEALARKPTVQGTLVVAIHRGQPPRIEMATFNDEGLAACALERIAKVPLSGGAGMPPGLSLPISFGPRS